MAALGVFATAAVTAVTAQNTTAVTRVDYLSHRHGRGPDRRGAGRPRCPGHQDGHARHRPDCVDVVGARAAARRPAPARGRPGHGGLDRTCPAGRGGHRRLPATDSFPTPWWSRPTCGRRALLVGMAPSPADVDAMIEMGRRIHTRTDLGPRQRRAPSRRRRPAAPAAPPTRDDILCRRSPTCRAHPPPCRHPEHPWHRLLVVGGHRRPPRPGEDVPTSVTAASDFVHAALLGGAYWRLGRGHGPIDHFGWSAPGHGQPGA